MKPELKSQLNKILEGEALADFEKVYDKINKFTSKTLSERTEMLTELSYYKAEIGFLRKGLEAKIQQAQGTAYSAEHNRLSGAGTRPTGELVFAAVYKDQTYISLNTMLRLAQKWEEIVTDAYFILQKNHGIIGNEMA